ncbi:hypothetical protein FOZ61_011046 [Perkinsus olseni]|uniref:Uncharacterized protein n=1 Tax=Perkinsus olseni TaxID=32597 RepID=A0A7J6KZS2_PEROL|nr:hypothetical protein FOZ61_011046 [Perkinsus olseni]KAF4651936.1 hypothetical protein FOL46_009979 [Perkinsus olseni]
MAAFRHSVLFMMLALTSAIAIHSTSPKRPRAESVTEDNFDTMETEPSDQLNNLVDAKLAQLSKRMEVQMTELSQKTEAQRNELNKVKEEMTKLGSDLARLKRRTVVAQNVNDLDLLSETGRDCAPHKVRSVLD